MAENKDNQKSINLLIFLNRYYKIVCLLIILIIIGLGYVVIFKRNIALSKEKNLALKEKQEELANANNYYNQLKQLDNTISNFQTEQDKLLDKIAEVLPAKPELPELIVQLEALVKSSNFKLDSIDISESLKEKVPVNAGKGSTTTVKVKVKELLPALPEEMRILKITLTVSGGDYLSFKNTLLKNLEQHVRLFDLTSISFTAQAGETATYQLNLQTYYLAKGNQ